MKTDKNPQLTLDRLISELEKHEPKLFVRFDFGLFVPGEINSYRGYYEEAAIEYKEIYGSSTRIEDVLPNYKEALKRRFVGYKGGDYWFNNSTPVWVANYGESTGTILTGILDDRYRVILTTAYWNRP